MPEPGRAALGSVDESEKTSDGAAAHERQARDGAFAPVAAFIGKILQQRVDLLAG